MKRQQHVCLILILLFANSFWGAAFAQDRIRSLNFNEFSYRVGPPYCEEFGPTVKVHQGKFANEKDKFEVSQILYGNLTESSREQAVVVASCGPQVPAHPGFENDLVYVYGIENGQPDLLATFAFGQPWSFMGAATEVKRQDRLLLFDVIGVSLGVGSISFERMAGEARCCPTFHVTQTFRWNNGRFVLAHEQKNPWNEVQNPSAAANGIQMLDQGGGSFSERYPWYAEAVKRTIRQNWIQSSIDPSARADRNAKTTVTFTINHDGSVRNIRLFQSSGNRSMDDSAQRALLSVGHFPPLPLDYNGSYVSVTFEFSLGAR